MAHEKASKPKVAYNYKSINQAIIFVFWGRSGEQYLEVKLMKIPEAKIDQNKSMQQELAWQTAKPQCKTTISDLEKKNKV